MLQIKTDVGGLGCHGQSGQEFFGLVQRHFGVDGVVVASRFGGLEPNARHLGDKNQLVRMKRCGHRGGDFFHGQVEGFTRGRKPKRREQHHGTHIQGLHNASDIHLADQA